MAQNLSFSRINSALVPCAQIPDGTPAAAPSTGVGQGENGWDQRRDKDDTCKRGRLRAHHMGGCLSLLVLPFSVKGTVFMTETNGALVDITAKSSAYLPLQEACIHKLKHVSEAGIYPGLVEEFVIIGEKASDDSLILSLRSIQYDLAWERCRQLQAEDVIVKGKVVGGNKGGVVAIVEGLRSFVPFSQISSKSTAEELIDKELPLKFVEVDEEQSRLVLSNRKAMADSQAQLGIGSVVLGTVQSLKPYGAFIDISMAFSMLAR